MHASLLGTAFESYVINNDTLGAVQRTVRGIEVSDETLSYEIIRDVVIGDGHFLGQAQTIERMETRLHLSAIGRPQQSRGVGGARFERCLAVGAGAG